MPTLLPATKTKTMQRFERAGGTIGWRDEHNQCECFNSPVIGDKGTRERAPRDVSTRNERKVGYLSIIATVAMTGSLIALRLDWAVLSLVAISISLGLWIMAGMIALREFIRLGPARRVPKKTLGNEYPSLQPNGTQRHYVEQATDLGPLDGVTIKITANDLKQAPSLLKHLLRTGR